MTTRWAVVCATPTPEVPPLALGLCLGAARAQLGRAGVTAFDLTPRFVSTETELERNLVTGARHLLLCSNRLWDREANLALSRALRQLDPAGLVIHGGPSTPGPAPACERFLRDHPEVDLAVRGEGEATLPELLLALEAVGGLARLPAVPGVSFLHEGELRRGPDRPPLTELDALPSPYLTGLFDGLDPGHWQQAVVETHRGCPYGCAFCSWNSLPRSPPRPFGLARVEQELEWLAVRRVPALFVADPNFGILPRDVQVVQALVRARRRHGAPRLVVVEWTKQPGPQVEEMIRGLARSGLLHVGGISIQTRDPATLAAVRRPSLDPADHRRFLRLFREHRLPVHTFLMLGLPGSTRASWLADLRQELDQPTQLILFRTLLLPGSPMAEPEYRARYGIEGEEGGFVRATRTLPAAELAELARIGCLFTAAHNLGILRYLLLWLHWDRGLDLFRILTELVREPEDRWPLLAPLLAQAASPLIGPADRLDALPRNQAAWRQLHEEFGNWVTERFGAEVIEATVSVASAWRCICDAQTAVMPADELGYPRKVELPHDVVGWYTHRRQGAGPPLEQYSPADLQIELAPRFDAPWELGSALQETRRGQPDADQGWSSTLLTDGCGSAC